MHEERLVRLTVQRAPVADLQFLEIGGARVGRTAEHKQPLVLVGKERLKAVASEVWAERDGIDAPVFKAGLGIGCGSVADVAALSVEDDGIAGRDRIDRTAQERITVGAKGFVEGDVGLVGRGIGGGSADKGKIPSQ